MMFLVLLHYVFSTSLVIRFDGSLRLPRDPIPGFATAGLGRVASCGSAILLDDDQTVVALGGRSVPLMPDMTSGDVEYDGLIFGLEWAVQAAEGGDLDRFWGSSGDAAFITICGDCKTVIDHLNQVASPRKLKGKYVRSTQYIERLQDYARRRFGDVEVSFEHVLRADNVLCDALCSCAIDVKQADTISTAMEAIRTGEDLSSSTKLELPASKKKRFKYACTHFNRALDVISGNDIPFSTRIGLYREVARSADRTNDGVALRIIGATLVTESKRWPETSSDTGSIIANKKEAEMLGKVLGIRGLRLMSLNKEAKQAERKNRVAPNDDKLRSAFILDATGADVEGEIIRSPSSLLCRGEGTAEISSNLLDSWHHLALIQKSNIERGIWRRCLDEN